MGRPVVRLGRAQSYATCDECGHAFRAAIAADSRAQPEAVLAEDEQALLGIISAVVLSDSAVRPSEKEACREVFRGYTGRRLASEAVDDLLRSSRTRWGDPVDGLARIRCLVPERIKHRIVEAAYHICTADGEMHREESVLLSRVGEALDLGPRQVREAIDRAKQRPVRRL